MGNQKRKAPTGAARPSKKRRAVAADSLQWTTVEIPEMFDDAEGFFGLEEVKGVDVVRDGDMVRFVTTVDADDEKSKGAESEFEGFDDEPTTPKTQTKAKDELKTQAEPKKTLKQTKKEKAENKKKKQQQQQQVQKADAATENTEPLKKEQAERKQKKKAASTPKEDSELESNVFATVGDAIAEDTGEDVDMSDWLPLDLSTQMLSSLARLKFNKPTDIQAAAIPEILAGHDVIGKASTGSGKTLAFAIPAVEAWLAKQESGGAKDDHTPICLILSPTRELAHQLTKHIRDLCQGLPTAPYICSVTGGLSVFKQKRQLEKADIVVATPGRLWDVLSTETKMLNSFKRVSFLVVDEADRLLSDGHFKEAEEILLALDRIHFDGQNEPPTLFPRQTLVFSATFNKNLQQKLTGKSKFNLMDDAQSMEYLLKKLNFREEKPKFVDVNPVKQMAQGLKEGLVECDAMEKDLYLYAVLLLKPASRVLVFTNAVETARRLIPLLQNLNLPVHLLQSHMAQKARLRSIERFTAAKPGESSILVATDVAARGLDIPGIDIVIHYHVPKAADTYVHRSGRTARAETSGLSVLLCSPEEVMPTQRLIAKVHASAKNASKNYFVRTIDIDRRLVARLKERVTLAKKLADTQQAKEKGNKEDKWLEEAAEELGVDSDTLEDARKWTGKGSDRKKKQAEAREVPKHQIGVWKAQLRELLSQRVNAGVSEKYIFGGGNVDVNQVLSGKGNFLGNVDGLGMEDE